jgi:hypothetical protein
LSLIKLPNSYLYESSNLLLPVIVRHNECAVSAFHWEE